MNSYLLCLVAALSAAPEPAPAPLYTLSPELHAAVRGQTPTYDNSPYYNSAPLTVPQTVPQSPMYAAPGQLGTAPYYAPGQPVLQDPFLASPGAVPYGSPAVQDPYAFGVNGPQPYQYGWKSRADFGYLPSADTDFGDFEIFELDTEIKHTTPLASGWIFSSGPQFNFRYWDGPAGLPSDVYRFGYLFELATPPKGPWSVQLTANPSIGTDFERTLNSDAYNWDAWGILFYRASPEWLFAFGAGFWDRVNDRVIPYAGVVWTPDPYWEVRLLFPQSRISYFMGNVFGVPSWLYVNAEYHVEAYQIELEPPNVRDKIELADYRVMLGLRSDHGFCTKFVEAGWVFGREVEFLHGTPGTEIDSGFIARAGLRY